MHPFGLLGEPKTYDVLEDRCMLFEELDLNNPRYPQRHRGRLNTKLSGFFYDCDKLHYGTLPRGKWLLLCCRMLSLDQWTGCCMFKARSFPKDLSHTCDHLGCLNPLDTTVEENLTNLNRQKDFANPRQSDFCDTHQPRCELYRSRVTKDQVLRIPVSLISACLSISGD